jgi:hypothetical protein
LTQNSSRNESIEALIMELCAEDYFGSWEFWWAVGHDAETGFDEQLALAFVESVSSLIESGKIQCYCSTADDKQFVRTAFSRNRLMSEVKGANSPDPDSSYWFWRATTPDPTRR